MLRDFCIPLTMKIMGLGLPLHKAERLAALIVIECLVVYTIMGYRFPAREPEPDTGIPSAHAGIHTGTKKSVSGEWVNVDARRRLTHFLAPSASLPA
ncbi:MAG: hypothetical protein Q7T80_15230 [Methanoregula sp.]|nr:hypothetical protein [Methanoregula sp.]